MIEAKAQTLKRRQSSPALTNGAIDHTSLVHKWLLADRLARAIDLLPNKRLVH
jgi:hypothetical protein